MKQAKGGNRERIISWLFNERVRKKRETLEEEEAKEKDKKEKLEKKNKTIEDKEEVIDTTALRPVITQEKEVKDTTEKAESVVGSPTIQPVVTQEKEVKNTDEKAESITTTPSFQPIITQEKEVKEETIEKPEIKPTTKMSTEPVLVSTSENKDNSTPNTPYIIVKRPSEKIEKSRSENSQPVDDVPILIEDKSKKIDSTTPPPSLFVEEEIVEAIKENRREQQEEVNSDKIFPEISSEVTEITEENIAVIEQPEILQISIIEEINELLNDDKIELQDIKYKIEVLQSEEKDEFLLQNIERIQRELEELIKRFEEIRKKYDKSYQNLTIKDLTAISEGKDVENTLRDFVNNSKNGNVDESIYQIKEIQSFIDIVNNIIEIDKQKDTVKESVDEKVTEYQKRDADFIKLEDQYANVEQINYQIQRYNREISSSVEDLKKKVDSSIINITRRTYSAASLVPNMNRIMRATLELVASSMIPPTPRGNLFRTGILAHSAMLLANSFRIRERQYEVRDVQFDDYTNDLMEGKDTISSSLNNITDAIDQISYIKDVFEKEFAEYQKQIPEYASLLQNIFAIEQELTRQQKEIMEFDIQLDNSIDQNKEKVLIYEDVA